MLATDIFIVQGLSTLLVHGLNDRELTEFATVVASHLRALPQAEAIQRYRQLPELLTDYLPMPSILSPGSSRHLVGH